MRKKQSFLLTVVTPENGAAAFCGQIKVIASGKTCTFTSLEDLYRLIAGEMDDDTVQRRPTVNLTLSEEQATA